MSDPTKVKTTDDGVDIYVNEDGQFLAVVGDCHCGHDGYTTLRGAHRYYCKAKTISRKSMADLEREVRKTSAPKASLKTISTESYYQPNLIEIIGVEKDRSGSTRYRGASGDLVSGYGSLYVYTDENWRLVQEVWAEYKAAQQKWTDLSKSLPRVTRENFRQLLAEQQEQSADA